MIYIKREEKLISRKVDEETMILNLNDNSVCTLNSVGTTIWEFVHTEERSIQEIMQLILDEYDVEPQALEKDMKEFLDNMKVQKLVCISER